MSGLWRNSEEAPEGKYLVQRRDGTIPGWAWFVLGERDPAAPAALFAYADAAEEQGFDPEYVRDIRSMAATWMLQHENGVIESGDPDAKPHRKDSPEIIEKMKLGNSA